MARSYVVDLPGGTATQSVQMQSAGTLKTVLVSMQNAAVGKLEISLSPATQIGTAQPTKDVLARVNNSATAAPINLQIDIPDSKLKAFDYVYFHQTGAGNVGSITFVL